MNDEIVKLDKYDTIIAVASGSITSICDFVFVKDIDLREAHNWGVKKTDEFVIKVAKTRGYKGDDIYGAIKQLEDDFAMASDDVTHEFGGGKQHHLRDFSHHPTPVGLVFSILTQLTGRGYGTNNKGEFVTYNIPDVEPKDIVSAIYAGFFPWIMHLISDIAGSSGTRRGLGIGTGLPGPLMSLLKEVSSIPGIRSLAGINENGNYEFSVMCSKMFNGTIFAEHEGKKIVKDTQIPFDLRTEIGIINESINNKQYLPVMFNNIIVAAGYSVRRFINQIKKYECRTLEDLEKIDIKLCLPYRKNDAFRHMKIISTATFSSVDIISSGIKAAVHNKNNKTGFALEFTQGINYWGLGDLAFSSNSEILAVVGEMKEGFVALAEQQKQELIKRLPNGEKDYETGRFIVDEVISITEIGTPIGFVTATIGVYRAIRDAYKDLEEATENRIKVEAECAARIKAIEDNQELMEETISDYLYSRMNVFVNAFESMDRAITNNDIDEFIMGNNMIQVELVGETKFDNMDEFNDMMLSDDSISF